MKALVVGYGSIGMRHVRLLVERGMDVAVVSRRPVSASMVFHNVGEAMRRWTPDYVVVASKTVEHWADVKTIADAGFAGIVLVEKPLFADLRDIPQHTFKKGIVGYNLRFHPVIQTVRQMLDGETILAVHAYCGSALQKWRPSNDYRQGYSAKKAEGGGVLRDLSHELDYVIWLLGDWQRVAAVGGQFSNLEIDSDDMFSILMETRRCPVVTISINYIDEDAHRTLVAITNRGTLRADLIAGTVTYRDERKYFTVERDTTYRAQHDAALDHDHGSLCDLNAGHNVVVLISAIERAATEQRWVRQ